MRRFAITTISYGVLVGCLLHGYVEPAWGSESGNSGIPAATATAGPSYLPPPVLHMLKKFRVSPKSLSVYIHQIGAESPLVAWNADRPRNPASTIKLLTTLTALEELGPAYRWKTEAYLTSPIKGGVMKGDLYLKGYGDPFLVMEYFWRLLRSMRKRGLKHIDGDLVLDDSYFRLRAEDPSEFDGRPYRSYNVSPSALLLNFQSVNFYFDPDPAGEQLKIVAEPDLGFKIDNRVHLAPGKCGKRWKQRIKMRVNDQLSNSLVKFSGKYSSACGSRSFYRVISDAAKYVYGAFKSLWLEQGGYFNGELRQEPLPNDARLFYTAHSLALSDIIRSINKYSNNVMTRQLLLTLGAETYGSPGTTEKGIRVIKEWLRRQGLEFSELVLDNGAGLSRDTRITAKHLGQLLLVAYTSRYMPEFMSSLPIAAEDGTMRNRLEGSELAGRIHIKTGLLDNVRGMAGYLLDRDNRRWVIVSLHNHAKAPFQAGRAVQDALLDWLYGRGIAGQAK